MNIVKTYGNYIKKYAGTHPAVSRKMIDIGHYISNSSGLNILQKKQCRKHIRS